jgi:surface carbohydrate biosynthesis protein (TIGR04326 family)
LRRFNDDALNQGCHAFLDSYLTFGFMWQLARSWQWLISVSRRLKGIESAFYPAGSAVWLWPLLRADWLSSLVGPVALSNCLSILLFDRALADMPHQELGLYLCENQAWEKALLRAWRRYRHGRIIGVQHSTAPFWHLYYFDDPRCRDSHGRYPLPLPDQLAVNGAAAHSAFIESGFPPERLVEVEALRYLNLAGSRLHGTPQRDHCEVPASAGGVPRAIKVLVLGDMIAASVDHLFSLLEGAMRHIAGGIKLTFKAHPGHAVDLAAYPTLTMQQTGESLSQILSEFDVVVAANSTSACVDAYMAGLPVIVDLDGDGLNLSPLRGQPGVYFVSSAGEMIVALQAVAQGESRTHSDRADFFCLDLELPRWKRLLELASPT